MILKALYDYYDRCKDKLAPIGLSYEEFDYSIIIDKDGHFVKFKCLLDENEAGCELLVVRPEERTSAPTPRLFGDNGSYALGLKNIKDLADFDKEFEANLKNHSTFVDAVNIAYKKIPNNKYVSAIWNFYLQYQKEVVDLMSKDIEWTRFVKHLGGNITFSIQGETGYAVNDQEIISYLQQSKRNDQQERICLITGKLAKPVLGTYSTFILGGKSNARLVSFQENSGYDSYGKSRCLNAPISEEAEFKYTTALRSLLKSGSRNKFQIGSRTYLFWGSSSSEASKQAEESIFNMFGFDDKKDDPNANVDKVKEVFKSISSGEIKTDCNDTFYFLGLAPNSARIAVVYWSEFELKKFAKYILKHFDDMQIIDDGKYKNSYYGLNDILKSITFKKDIKGPDSKLIPNLPEAVTKSIFEGCPYPTTLFTACLRRIKAETAKNGESEITVTRAAILKAYLNRINDNNNLKINIMLDKQIENQGYLCGRLFAVLVKIQELSNKENGYKSTIGVRYMSSASTTPSVVFPTLLNLSIHHLEKIQNPKWLLDIEGEIMDKIQATGFSSQLSMNDQGRFFIGYYHQRQDFFTSKKEDNQE